MILPAATKPSPVVEPATRGRLEPPARFGCERSARGDEQDDADPADDSVHFQVTLSGTGLVVSRAVYHGISRKNKK